MKTCLKLSEPASLATYRKAVPDGTWEEMRADAFHQGQQAAQDIKRTLVRGQRCLCAFCEMRIADGTSPEELHARQHEQRVEHFHPKSDTGGTLNWALHWPNLWAVCQGGSQSPPAGEPIDTHRYLPPLPANLSCDAFKDHQIARGQLDSSPEGWILAPDQVPAFPPLFQFAPNGTPEPHAENCSSWTTEVNHYPDTTTLVSKTIEHLNLGCPRLKRNRCIAKAQLEKRIGAARKRAAGAHPDSVLLSLARDLFLGSSDSPWPEFFTLVRWRIGAQAEMHLRSSEFDG